MGGGAHLAVLGELGHAQRAVAGLELVRLGVLEPARGELLLERRHLLVARHVAEEVAAVADLHHLQLDFGACRKLENIEKLGKGLKQLRRLAHLELDFNRCELIPDLQELGRSVGNLQRLELRCGRMAVRHQK